MKSKDIWDTKAAQSYDTPGKGMFAPEILNPTVDKLVELAGSGRALEFAIGTGRVAVPLSERGVRVVVIESSSAMIAQLRRKSDEATIPVVLGDMATACASGRFTLVFLVYNTISNLLTQEEQVSCFRNAADHLEPGGRFVVELWVPELRKLTPGQHGIVSNSAPGYICVDTYDVLSQTLVSQHFQSKENGQVQVFRSPHRYIWPSELDLMANLAGFEIESRHSDWAGSPFTSESPSHVSIYRLLDK